MLNSKSLNVVITALRPSLGGAILFNAKEFADLFSLLKDTAIRMELMEQEISEHKKEVSSIYLSCESATNVIDILMQRENREKSVPDILA